MSQAIKKIWPCCSAHAQTSALTYQGKLSDAGAPANGQYELEFKLFDAGGAQISATQAREDVQVTNGSPTRFCKR